MKNVAIPLLSDSLSGEELEALIKARTNEINLITIEDGEYGSRSPFSDPAVLAALIGAGATTLASIITLLGVIWTTRQNEKKASPASIIIVRIDKNAAEVLTTAQMKLPEHIAQPLIENQDLVFTIEDAAKLGNQDNPYHALLEELSPEHVKQISVLENR